MDFEIRESPEIQAFRREVSDWLDENVEDDFPPTRTPVTSHTRTFSKHVGWAGNLVKSGGSGQLRPASMAVEGSASNTDSSLTTN